MTDSDYTIEAEIVVVDKSGPGAEAASRRLGQVERQAMGIGDRIAGMFGRAFAILGGAAGIGAAVRGMIGLNQEIDEAQRGLAGLFTAQLGMPIASSVGLARQEIRGLREDAKKGVGELSDYIRGYQGLFGVAGSSVELSKLRTLNRNALAAGFAIQGEHGLYTAPMDLTQALTSGAGDRVTPIVMAALRANGMTAERFNRLDIAGRVEALNAAFGRFGPAVELMGKSWSAQSSTFRDNLKEILRGGSTPIFERWTESLRNANVWLEEHAALLEHLTSQWGKRALDIWDALISRAGTYAMIAGGVSIGGRLAGAGLAGARAASASGVGGIVGAVGSATGAGALAIGAAATAAATAGVAVAFLSVREAIRTYPDLLGRLELHFIGLQAPLGRLETSLGGLAARTGTFTFLGEVILGTADAAVTGADGLLRLADSILALWDISLTSAMDGIQTIRLLASGNFAGAAAYSQGMQAARALQFGARLDRIWDRDADFGAYLTGRSREDFLADRGRASENPVEPPVNKPPPPINFNGPVTMQLKTEMNADPNRVTMAWDEGVERLIRFPVQARRVLPGAG